MVGIEMQMPKGCDDCIFMLRRTVPAVPALNYNRCIALGYKPIEAEEKRSARCPLIDLTDDLK